MAITITGEHVLLEARAYDIESGDGEPGTVERML